MRPTSSSLWQHRSIDMKDIRSEHDHSLSRVSLTRHNSPSHRVLHRIDAIKSPSKLSAAKRVGKVIGIHLVKIYLNFMLKLSRKDAEDLSHSMSICQMARSRASSRTQVFLPSRKSFRYVPATLNCGNTRQIVGLINKKILQVKNWPFQQLKRNMNRKRAINDGIWKSANIIRDLMKKQSRRLKRQMFFKMTAFVYSVVRTRKCVLQKSMCLNNRKGGQFLCRLLKKLFKNKLRQAVHYVKQYGKSSRILDKLQLLIEKITNRNAITCKKETMRQLRVNTVMVNNFRRTVMFSNALFRRLQLKQIEFGFKQLWSNCHSQTKLKAWSLHFTQLFNKLRLKAQSHSFGMLKTHKFLAMFKDSVVNSSRQAQDNTILNELQMNELGKYKQCLTSTERLLRKQQLQNRDLTQRLIFHDKLHIQSARQIKFLRFQNVRLERQLKDKDAVIKRFLLQQNKTNEIMSKQREEIMLLRSNRQFNCQCTQAKNKQFAELVLVGKGLDQLIRTHVEVDEQTPYPTENDMVRHNFEIMLGVIDQSQKLAGGLSLNPLLKNDYPVLSYIRNSFIQVKQYVEAKLSNYLTISTVDRYLNTMWLVPHQRQSQGFDITKMTNDLLQSLKPKAETPGYRTIKNKIVEFSKNADNFNRQYRKFIDKNATLKNLTGRLELNDRDIRTYIMEMKDLGIVVKNIFHHHGTKSDDSSAQMTAILKSLFMDFLDEKSSYHKKKTVRQQICKHLNLTAQQRAVFQTPVY